MFLSSMETIKGYSIGLDVSMTASGCYYASMHPDLDDYYCELINRDTKTRDTYRVFEMATAIIEDLEAIQSFAPVAIVVMEDYGPINKFAGKITQRAEICGIVKHHIISRMRVPFATISPTSLKKYTTGSGRSEKDSMVSHAESMYGLVTKSNNIADASHLAHFGYGLLSGRNPHCEYQRFSPD